MFNLAEIYYVVAATGVLAAAIYYIIILRYKNEPPCSEENTHRSFPRRGNSIISGPWPI
jgi:hypothetical protein